MSLEQTRLDRLKKVKSEIGFYIDASEGTSIDAINLYSKKLNILQDIAYVIRDYPITDENSNSFDKIFKVVDTLRSIKGLSPLDLIYSKVRILRKNIRFLHNISS